MDATVRRMGEMQADLESVDAAIRAAITGQSYSIEGQTYTRQDLPRLRDQRTMIVRQIRELEAVLRGAESPGEAVATWYR